MDSSVDLIKKKQRAIDSLRQHSRVLVALSGGVDSATLLAVACEAVGTCDVLAVTGKSASVSEAELRDAIDVARRLGVRHRIVDTFELTDPRYRENSGDRCFHCRSELFGVLKRVAGEEGLDAIAYGAIADDRPGDRPGMKAAEMAGVLAPLLEARLFKDDIRALAYSYGLHISEKPASACLASRIPVGTAVTEERLSQVDAAESALRRLGLVQVRVRHHGEIARVEMGPSDLARLADPELRQSAAMGVRAAGFRFVTVDLEGYREGGADRSLKPKLYSIAPHSDTGQ